MNAVGIEGEEAVSLVFAVDWLLDRIRTTINIVSDTMVAIIVDDMAASDEKSKIPK
eukprot:TRINITY_DN5771_c0_g1_i1.p2 TRINITY_DN5771_c0_g1~~TRINITY_DN5771_c0_g1_i1.p2  ORF type:complete len:56 (-),score=14.91 TRINITY_DN5771_c0_g1_i1:133-300(-)